MPDIVSMRQPGRPCASSRKGSMPDIHKVLHPVIPGVETMGIVGGVALTANLTCFFLLYRYRADNLNMSSTWLCSRNDLVANVGVLLAAAGSYLLTSRCRTSS